MRQQQHLEMVADVHMYRCCTDEHRLINCKIKYGLIDGNCKLLPTSLLLVLQVQLVESAPAFDDELEQVVACQLAAHLQERMAGYK
jgi:hypothetical protein